MQTVQTASEEMRNFASLRSERLLEIAASEVAGTALRVIAGRLDGVLIELKALFLALLAAFGVAVQNLVPQLIPVLAFRCPRCSGLFHAASDRLGLRACAHCGLRVKASEEPSN